MESYSSESPAILADLENEMILEPASTGLRFANLLLDLVGFYALFFLAGIGLGLAALAGNDVDTGLNLGAGERFLLSYTVYILYYTVAEGLTKGRSFGKLITGTQAVREDGTTFTWKDAFLRTLCRLVPFEPFSAFGYAPWHDKWTNTLVIKKQR